MQCSLRFESLARSAGAGAWRRGAQFGGAWLLRCPAPAAPRRRAHERAQTRYAHAQPSSASGAPPPHTHNLPAGSYQAALAAGARGGGVFLSEASVGAGLPVLSTLRELVQTGDRVTRIEVRGRPLPRWLSAVVGGGGGYSPTF